MSRQIVVRVLGLLVAAGIGSRAQSGPVVRISVHVHDSSTALAGAGVAVVRGVNDARASGVTDDQGRVTLRLPAPEATADYQLVVRKIGYQRSDQFFRVTGDSMAFDVAVRRVVELSPVVVTADQDLKRKSYHVGADDIANTTEVLLDATDILAKMRPDMICGRRCSPTASIAAITRNPVRKCPTLTFVQPQPRACPRSDEPPSYATNVWVNGQRLRIAIPDEMAVARQHGLLAGLSAASMTVLSEIQPEHIAEMTYVDEWDTTIDKLGAQGGLFVVLKPGVAYEPGKRSYVLPSDPARTQHAVVAAAAASLPTYRFRLLGVYDTDTGEPIEGAHVTDMSTGTKARTTSTGTVSLAFLPEGGTPLRITKEGYDDLTIAVEISSEHTDPLTLVMVRQPKPPHHMD